MSIGPDNLLYVTQWGTTAPYRKIVRFDLDGNYLGPFTPIAPTGLGHLWDDNGNFYLPFWCEYQWRRHQKIRYQWHFFLRPFIDSSVLENPTTFGGAKIMKCLFRDFTQGKVLHYDSDGNFLEDYITGLLNPEGYEFLPNGHLLVCERTGNQILEFDTNGTL